MFLVCACMYFRYANNTFIKNQHSKHYALNHFFRKTGFGTFFYQIKSGHYINVQLSKNFFETQIDFFYPPTYIFYRVYILK